MAFYHRLLLFPAGFLFFALGGNSQGKCPSSWIYLKGSCYKFSSNALNWNAANKSCKAMGSTLAMVTSQTEQQALSPKITQFTWIGLHRDPKDISRWLWIDGTRPTYTNWNTGEPNGLHERCGEIWTSAYKWRWNDESCSSARQYVCETSARVTNCPALTVEDLVKISPGSCVTSQMKINTKCSFKCPQGYQLKGPSFCKQCSARGQWTNSNKSVSCVDLDECSLSSNGGCSHKCINTKGGYKCECPDPELSLSPDNKTCHAPGVDVHCNSSDMTIIIPKSLLRGTDREHLRLLDTACKATETSAYFSLTTPLTGCNTTRRHTASTFVYSNTVLEIPLAAKDVITRVRELEIQFSCFYSKYGVISSVGWKPNNRKLVFSDEGKGNFTLSLNMFPDKRFVSPYMKVDFPVAVILRKRLFFEVSVTSSDKQLSIIADQCFATPTQNERNSLKYIFITKGCPSDLTVKYHSAPTVSAHQFSLEAFKFIADHPFVFVHCHVIVCNATDPTSKCGKKCSPSGRGRREVSSHMTDDVYMLAQGPIHLGHQKRDANEGGVDQSGERLGSSPSLMMALFLMCLIGFSGTALLAFKKSRDKPVGYTVLATGDHE